MTNGKGTRKQLFFLLNEKLSLMNQSIKKIKSNQLNFIGQRSSKGYYKRTGGGMDIWEGSLGCEFLLGWMCAEEMVCGRR